jgi:ammonium transporter
MLTASAFVMLMVPGLALFYGGMVRRKNVLGTMMHSMVALSVVGVFWIAVGYNLAFGPSHAGLIGWSNELFFLWNIGPDKVLPGTDIPVYVHMIYQGMFAIITPALISGAVAERIRFKPYCLFLLLWITLVYCPLAHWVWATDAFNAVPLDPIKGLGNSPAGWLGKLGALDFAGGTVVHVAAGLSSLAAILLLRKRIGYPEHAMHPNSMVLTLTGAGLLWFGWFGFNGGSGLQSGALAGSAFAATQAAAAAAGLSWMLAEWWHKGKPTALGLASGIVAGLVAVTPASGYIFPWGGLAIGIIAGLVCYGAVCLKPKFGYDDSLDAFGVHGVGGFLGAILTGVFCYAAVNSNGADGLLAGNAGQMTTQAIAAVVSVVFTFGMSLVLVKLVDVVIGFTVEARDETEGLDRSEHGEVGFDLSLALETVPEGPAHEPRPALVPPNGMKRFTVVVDGADAGELKKTWSELCQIGPAPPPTEFRAIYPYMTTMQGNRFHFRGGDRKVLSEDLRRLLQDRLSSPVTVYVEN